MEDTLLSRMVRDRVDRRWVLFLDRDGVINTRIVDGYVRQWNDFGFTPGAIGALATLSRWAPEIAVVTNQQGVGKRLMSADALNDIHSRMRAIIGTQGGRIDRILVCPHLAIEGCDCRKPAPGLALDYLSGRREVDGRLSIMVGDTDSDIEMGRRLGRISGGCALVRIDDRTDPHADLTFRTLAEFAAAVDQELRTAAICDQSAE